MVYAEQKRYDQALQAFNRSLEIDPEYGWALTSKGSVLMQAGRPEEAIKDFDAALNISPDDPGARLMKAQALAMLGQQNESGQTYGPKGSAEGRRRNRARRFAREPLPRAARQGHRAHRSGKLCRGHPGLRECYCTGSRARSAWLMMAFAADRTARYEKALLAYEGVLALNGNDSQLCSEKGMPFTSRAGMKSRRSLQRRY